VPATTRSPSERRLEAAGAWSLVAMTPAGNVIIPVPSRGTRTIGRGDGCDIRLDDLSLSRVHAEIRADASGLAFVDLASTNGSAVHGAHAPPNTPVALAAGDLIAIGQTLLCVSRAAPAPRVPTLYLSSGHFEAHVDKACRRAQPFAIVRLRFADPLTLATTDAMRVRSFAALLKAADVVTNYPPEEFLVLLDRTTADAANARAAELRAAFTQSKIAFELAVAAFPDDGDSAEELLAATRDFDPERRRVLKAMADAGGNQRVAAKRLGIAPNTLAARLDAYGIDRPRKSRKRRP
jgi:predicted component of type VI protein secretion system